MPGHNDPYRQSGILPTPPYLEGSAPRRPYLSVSVGDTGPDEPDPYVAIGLHATGGITATMTTTVEGAAMMRDTLNAVLVQMEGSPDVQR